MTDSLLKEFSYDGDIPLMIMLIRLLGCIMLCGVIGLEREIRKDTAGLRTNILIGTSSAMYALIALNMMEFDGAHDGIRIDPIRLIEAVTAGVAFLAAGIVVFSKGSVRGLTTGATMWMSGGIGLSIGLGYWWIAVTSTGLCLIVLLGLRYLERVARLK